MATGMFRTGDDWAQVDYDGGNIPVPRSKYVKNGYKPHFDKLALEAENWVAQEKAKAHRHQGVLKASPAYVIGAPAQSP